MIYARINVNVDTGVYLFLHISCGTEYSQHSNALAHPNPSANSNKFKLLPYHCYAKASGGFMFIQLRLPFLSQDSFNVTSFVSIAEPNSFRPIEKLPAAVLPLLLAFLEIVYHSEL